MKKSTGGTSTTTLRALPVRKMVNIETRPAKNVSGTLVSPKLTNDVTHMTGTVADPKGTAKKPR
jgi:hypothetical protein